MIKTIAQEFGEMALQTGLLRRRHEQQEDALKHFVAGAAGALSIRMEIDRLPEAERKAAWTKVLEELARYIVRFEKEPSA